MTFDTEEADKTMITADTSLLYADITDRIIACAFDVYNKLGFGFSEKVYENAMMVKLQQRNLTAIQQAPISVHFEGHIVGEYFIDIFIDNKILLELKAVSLLSKFHEVQLVNYLKATGVKVGLLINFGVKLKIVRRVF